MAATRKQRTEAQAKVFHARMLVTRAEEWWVEAESVEAAEKLLGAGKAHRHTLGELLHVDLEEVLVEEVPEDGEE